MYGGWKLQHRSITHAIIMPEYRDGKLAGLEQFSVKIDYFKNIRQRHKEIDHWEGKTSVMQFIRRPLHDSSWGAFRSSPAWKKKKP